MIKILYLPLNVGGNVQQGMYDAFNSLPQVELKIYDFYGRFEQTRSQSLVSQEFLAAVDSFQPDLCHKQLQMTDILTAEVLKKAKSLVKHKSIFINWSGDVRNTASPSIIKLANSLDYTFISSVGQLDLYKKSGCDNVKYWQIGYDPKLFFPQWKNDFQYDAVFAGNAYPHGTFLDGDLRNRMIIELKRRLGNRLFVCGSGWSPDVSAGCVTGSALNNLYNSSRCIFAMSNYNDISHYFSDRLLTCLASGRPTISYRFPDYQTYFSNNEDILIAENIEEIIYKVNYCRDNPEFANEIGANGFRKVKSEHTYKSRVIELLSILGLLQE